MLLLDLRSFNVKNTIFFYNLLSSQIMNWATLFSLLHHVNYFLLCINHELTLKYVRFGVSLGVYPQSLLGKFLSLNLLLHVICERTTTPSFYDVIKPKRIDFVFPIFHERVVCGLDIKRTTIHFIYDLFKTQKIDSQKLGCVPLFYFIYLFILQDKNLV